MNNTTTTYTIRKNATGRWDLTFVRPNGTYGYAHSGLTLLESAVSEARRMASASDRIYVRKSRYEGRNAGAWHSVANG